MAPTYEVLARKWRSSQLRDIVGQTHVTRTLINAIRAGRIHHAYLFTGSRGIGKTSIARIFAKLLRCQNRVDDPTQPLGLASCDACPECREIATGSSVDVLEIDGASNNGVDAVREIREQVRYSPTRGERKIYIIDEVHMLTTAAFNALLKTLEEPPSHVLFIFATTEPHKIPSTILSRVQRFDFRRPSPAQIEEHLRRILAAEGIGAEDEALRVVSRAADGSLRDSLSLLDQVISFSGTVPGGGGAVAITAEACRESLGWVAGSAVLEFVTALLRRDPGPALAQIDAAYRQGHDLKILARSALDLLHEALLAVATAPGEPGGDARAQVLRDAALPRGVEELDLIFQAFHHGLEQLARSPAPRLYLDALVLKCARAEALVQLGRETTAAPAVSATGTVAAPAAPAPIPRPVIAATPAARPEPAATPVPAPAARTWETWIAEVRRAKPLLASILEHAVCARFPAREGDDFRIAFRAADAYYREQIQARASQEQLTAINQAFFGRPLRLQIAAEAADGSTPPEETIADRKVREAKERIERAREQARAHPAINEARALFGGELGPIEVVTATEPERK